MIPAQVIHHGRGAVPTGRAGGLTLERKLALLISALVAGVVVVFAVAAWRQMHEASVARTTERLARIARQLAAASDAGRTRAAVLRGAAATRELSDVVAGGPSTTLRDAARRRLEAMPVDTTASAWEVWTSGEERRLAYGALLTPRDAVVLAPARANALRTSTTQRSPLYAVRDTVYFWVAVPVLVNGQAVGVVAERRRINRSTRSAEAIRALVGDEVAVYLSSAPDGEWAEVSGAPTPPQFALPDTLGGAVRLVDRSGVPVYAAVGAIAGSPWLVVLAQPESAVLRRPREFLRTLLAIGALLVVVGTAAAWALGRHVARPLRELTGAAEALGRGNYDRRVDVGGGAEVARLSATFNAMAEAMGEAHRTLAERNAALQQANEAKSRFLAMMSHELRTPLNAIGGYTEIIELGLRGPVTDAQIQDLKRIRRSRDHLLSIITDILGFARADAGRLSLAMRDVRVADVLSEAESALEHMAREKHGVRLEVIAPPATLLVRADREKLQQVVFNLMTNAIRFTEADGHIRVWATATESDVAIHVRDDGIGIAPDKVDTIFDPFVQVDATLTRRVGGTGLGLAIARELAEAMHGTISVRSTIGVGSHFTVTLERAGVGAPQLRSSSADRSSAST